jgi:hypothetical protein
MANSFNVGRSVQSLGQQQVNAFLLAANQTINVGDPMVMTNVSGANRLRKLTAADVTANLSVSGSVAGIWGIAIATAVTDANGFSGGSNPPSGVSAGAYPIFPLPNYSDSIDVDPVTGVSRIGVAMASNKFDVRAATSGTVTGNTSNTSATLTITAVSTGISLTIGSLVTGTNIPTGTYITAFGTGTGGAGTYTMSAAATGTATGTTVTVYTVPVTTTIGAYMGQTTGLQAVSDGGSGLIDFSLNFAATGAGIFAYVSGFLEQDPYYNTLSNNCRVEISILSTYQQQVTGVIYTN